MSDKQIVPDSVVQKYARTIADRLREFMLIAGEAENWHTAEELAGLTEIPRETVSKLVHRVVCYRPYLKLESRYRGRVREYKLVRKA